MILESAVLNIRPGEAETFEAAFDKARHIIGSVPGFAGLGSANRRQRRPGWTGQTHSTYYLVRLSYRVSSSLSLKRRSG